MPINHNVSPEVDKLSFKLEAINTKLAELADDLDQLTTDFRSSLFGNGKPGIVNRIALLEQSQEQNKFWIRTGIMSLLGVAGGMVTFILNSHLK